MQPQGTRPPRSLFVRVIVVVVVLDRAQKMREGPLGHVAPLLPRLHVRKAKVDSLVDARVDHVRGGIREAVVRGHLCCGAGDVVCPGGVVRIVWIIDQWLPVRVAACSSGRTRMLGVAPKRSVFLMN